MDDCSYWVCSEPYSTEKVVSTTGRAVGLMGQHSAIALGLLNDYFAGTLSL